MKKLLPGLVAAMGTGAAVGAQVDLTLVNNTARLFVATQHLYLY